MWAICPYGQIGDHLWVRESFAVETNFNLDPCDPPFNDGRPVKWEENDEYGRYWAQAHYAATDPMPDLVDEDCPHQTCADNGYCQHWHPSIHMPRWASRITLEIAGTRAERVNDITYADCLKEGIEDLEESVGKSIAEFAALWDRINGERGYGWDKNPFVWVIEFKRVNDLASPCSTPFSQGGALI